MYETKQGDALSVFHVFQKAEATVGTASMIIYGPYMIIYGPYIIIYEPYIRIPPVWPCGDWGLIDFGNWEALGMAESLVLGRRRTTQDDVGRRRTT